ncbi:MAG: hypothetical protein ACEQSX_00425 [Baekduiaceae bacterium]
MSTCPRCGESRANPACPLCRRLQPEWEEAPQPGLFDAVLTCVGIVLEVATVLWFGLQVIGALVR